MTPVDGTGGVVDVRGLLAELEPLNRSRAEEFVVCRSLFPVSFVGGNASMVILDFLREMQGSRITIPPYHCGHLGFMSGTQLTMSLVQSSHPNFAEVIVTPFDQKPGHMARLVCFLRDAPGAVKAVVDAVAALAGC